MSPQGLGLVGLRDCWRGVWGGGVGGMITHAGVKIFFENNKLNVFINLYIYTARLPWLL